MEAGAILAGKYQLETLLGRGGMGSVWRARHLGLHAPVAIKLIDAHIVTNQEAIQRFHREARAAASLRSPHVVQILDHGLDEATHTPFIAMELMEGESLAQRLQRVGCLSLAETTRIITHVARALGRAHEAGIIHRDLKPDNVFIVQNEDEEIAKVLDFGIAKSQATLGSDSATRTGAVMGTPYYMSPEQIGGAKNVDARTDLWALGVMACECLTGRRPFEADSIGGLTLKICVEALPRASDLGPVPSGFDAWFERAVARNPAERFASARALADELRRVASTGMTAASQANLPSEHRATSAVTPGLAASLGPLSATSREATSETRGRGAGRAVWAALVVVVLAAAGAGARFLWGESRSGGDAASPDSSAAATPAPPPPTRAASAAVAVQAPDVAPVAEPLPPVSAPMPPASAAPVVAAAPLGTGARKDTRRAGTATGTHSAVTTADKPAPPASAPRGEKTKIDARSVIDQRR